MQATSPCAPRLDAKVIVLGGGGVGKSSLIYRYIHNDFKDTISTIAAAFAFKRWRSYHFGIWDTAGQDKFAKISSYYCKGASAAILAYDITDVNSFRQLPRYLDQLRAVESDCMVVIVGTKSDLVTENPEMRQVSVEESRRFAGDMRAVLFETSARSNVNIAQVFDHIGMSLFPATALTASQDTEQTVTSPSTAGGPIEGSSDRLCCRIQ